MSERVIVTEPGCAPRAMRLAEFVAALPPICELRRLHVLPAPPGGDGRDVYDTRPTPPARVPTPVGVPPAS